MTPEISPYELQQLIEYSHQAATGAVFVGMGLLLVLVSVLVFLASAYEDAKRHRAEAHFWGICTFLTVVILVNVQSVYSDIKLQARIEVITEKYETPEIAPSPQQPDNQEQADADGAEATDPS